jgi:hypothetical protein
VHLLKSTGGISLKNKKATECESMDEFKQIFTELASTINGIEEIIFCFYHEI